jgi:arabinofuranosyltransferase
MDANGRWWRMAALALGGLFTVVLIRTAWMSDDAYITLRTVDNFVNGHGLRWNVVERVQSFTHPLWTLVLAVPYAVTKEAYFTPLVLQMAIALAAVWVIGWRLAADRVSATAAIGVLVFSKAFVEYSTSGLENTLTHLLLALFLWTYWVFGRRRHVGLWLLAALLMTNRPDTGLLVLPALLTAWGSAARGTRLRDAAIGLTPLVAWEIFSVVYYGFPFPNTAYAKLQTGAAPADLFRQGTYYFADGLLQDPVTLAASVVMAGVSLARAPRESLPIVLGMVLYYAYILRIGGDFMTGRFFAAPLLCAVALFARLSWTAWPRLLTTAAVAVVAAGTFATTRPPITSGSETFILSAADGMGLSGIADERSFYYRYTGLLRWTREIPLPHNSEEVRGRQVRAEGPAVVVAGSIGLFGYFAGPDIHIVDVLALADPLLARLPAKPGWRIGHFERELPEGYVPTLETGTNLLADPEVFMLYERLKLVTQAPLWTERRWRAIRTLNLGR